MTRKSRLGRPPLGADKATLIGVYAVPALRARIVTAAKDAGQSVSAWMVKAAEMALSARAKLSTAPPRAGLDPRDPVPVVDPRKPPRRYTQS